LLIFNTFLKPILLRLMKTYLSYAMALGVLQCWWGQQQALMVIF